MNKVDLRSHYYVQENETIIQIQSTFTAKQLIKGEGGSLELNKSTQGRINLRLTCKTSVNYSSVHCLVVESILPQFSLFLTSVSLESFTHIQIYNLEKILK